MRTMRLMVPILSSPAVQGINATLDAATFHTLLHQKQLSLPFTMAWSFHHKITITTSPNKKFSPPHPPTSFTTKLPSITSPKKDVSEGIPISSAQNSAKLRPPGRSNRKETWKLFAKGKPSHHLSCHKGTFLHTTNALTLKSSKPLIVTFHIFIPYRFFTSQLHQPGSNYPFLHFTTFL